MLLTAKLYYKDEPHVWQWLIPQNENSGQRDLPLGLEKNIPNFLSFVRYQPVAEHHMSREALGPNSKTEYNIVTVLSALEIIFAYYLI